MKLLFQAIKISTYIDLVNLSCHMEMKFVMDNFKVFIDAIWLKSEMRNHDRESFQLLN